MTKSSTRTTLRRDPAAPGFAPDIAGGVARSDPRRVILLATSGSRSAIEATVFAAELAAALGATLRIVHVIAPIQYRVGRLAPMRAMQSKLTDPFESPVLSQAREFAWRHGAAATLQLIAGEPARAIVDAAANYHADLLVIGGRHRHWLLRGKAPTLRWVLAHAPCQVLTPAVRGEVALS